MTYRSFLRIVATPPPVRRFSSSHFSLVNRAVCPSTESTVNILKDMKIPEFNTVRQLTDELLSIQNLIINGNLTHDLDQQHLDEKVDILQSIVNKYKGKSNPMNYDYSFPFRHAMIIRHYYETNRKSKKWFENMVNGPKNKKQHNNIESMCCKNKFKFHNQNKHMYIRNAIKIRV